MMIVLVFAMTAVTYLPRLLPFVLIDFSRLPPALIRVLRSVPAAALGALLVPGVATSVGGRIDASLAGALAAVLAALIFRRVIVTLLAAVAAALSVLWLLPVV